MIKRNLFPIVSIVAMLITWLYRDYLSIFFLPTLVTIVIIELSICMFLLNEGRYHTAKRLTILEARIWAVSRKISKKDG